jgi:hypothetical protein
MRNWCDVRGLRGDIVKFHATLFTPKGPYTDRLASLFSKQAEYCNGLAFDHLLIFFYSR